MNIQRAPQGTLRVTITNSIVSETNCNTSDVASSSRNSHFTPCRRVGLSRKRSQNVSLNKSSTSFKYEEPSTSMVQQMPSEKHSRNKTSTNENTPVRAYEETINPNEKLKFQNDESFTPINHNDDSLSDNETKYSQTPNFKNQVESTITKNRKKNKSKIQLSQKDNDTVIKKDEESDTAEECKEIPELKKRKRDPHILNNSEHTGNSVKHLSDHNNAISSIQIKNIVTGPERSTIEENNSPSNLSQSSVKKISITVKQKLNKNKWSTSTKVHVSQDESAVSDAESIGNSKLSDFSHTSSRRKKRRAVNNKHKRTSPKPGPSRPNTEPKYAVTQTFDSDSEDDFATTHRRTKQDLIPIKNEHSSQSSVKEESGNSQTSNVDKKKMKKLRKRSVMDELNKTEQIRIAENKSYTIIYKGNTISYVKSHDNDVDFKTAESDDNQQKLSNCDPPPVQKSMIIERKSYVTEPPPPLSSQQEEEDERSTQTSLFDSTLDGASTPLSCSVPNETDTKTQSSQSSGSTKRSKLSLSKSSEHTNTVPRTEKGKEENRKQSTPSKLSTNSLINEINTEKHMDVGKLRKKCTALENKIKLKQEKIERLKRVSVYKKTHDLDELHAVTLQNKQGAQSSLFDLLLILNSVSQEPCDMRTLLHNLKIPNELVDYNADEDKFM